MRLLKEFIEAFVEEDLLFRRALTKYLSGA